MENTQLTLGSLFSGSGGFELAGMFAGIKPVFLSEIEPYPVLVTHNRLPDVKHYGDVSKLSGAELPLVDIITFGSPCQDVSIAGKRAGLSGSRSGLFFQAIRIIKEMRDATNGKYPRYAVYENVTGVLSSNNGEDFRTVLEEICKIKEDSISVPRPPKKWTNAGEILGDNFSVAYRMLDACGWGVPQRRKRIYLVADFNGTSAGKVLFESEGLSGYTPQGFRAWEGPAGGAAESTGTAGRLETVLNDQGGIRMDVTEGVTCTLRAEAHHPPCVLESAGFCTEHSAKARGIGYEEETSPTLRAGVVPAALLFENHSADTRYRGPLDVSPTLSATLGMGGNNQPFVVEPPDTIPLESHPTDSRIKIAGEDVCQTLTERMGTGGGNVPLVMENAKTYDVRFTSEGTRNARSNVYETDTSRTIDTGGNAPDSNQGGVAVCEPKVYGICSKHSNSMLSDNPHSGFYEADSSRTLDTSGGNPSSNQGGMVVLEGNGSRPSHKGDGYRESETMYTLNTVEVPAVAMAEPSFAISRDNHFSVSEDVAVTSVARGPATVAHPEGGHYSTSKNSHHTVAAHEQANTLVASDWKDPPLVNDTPNNEPVYIVRRLTPTECARLQGLPDWWCKNLDNQNPTDDDIAFWTEVWNEWTALNGKKPKSESQIRKWLADPYSDSAEYKLYGNGIAVPCGYFVLAGIAWAAFADTE